jgi:hypothetical protein
VIHARHRDFKVFCGDRPLDECYASLPVIARRVQEVKDELLTTRGIVADHVIMTSDEDNATWWQGVEEQGWKRLHHLKWAQADEPTGEPPVKGAPERLQRLHSWYPLILDAVVQSSGVGFVGTDGSTMSMIARRRTETWNNGVSRTVKWGNPHSDDH